MSRSSTTADCSRRRSVSRDMCTTSRRGRSRLWCRTDELTGRTFVRLCGLPFRWHVRVRDTAVSRTHHEGPAMPTNKELQDELQSLRDEVRQLRAHLGAAEPTAKASEPRLMSRRTLLRAAPVVAAGGALAAMAASPAAA